MIAGFLRYMAAVTTGVFMLGLAAAHNAATVEAGAIVFVPAIAILVLLSYRLGKR